MLTNHSVWIRVVSAHSRQVHLIHRYVWQRTAESSLSGQQLCLVLLYTRYFCADFKVVTFEACV